MMFLYLSRFSAMIIILLILMQFCISAAVNKQKELIEEKLLPNEQKFNSELEHPRNEKNKELESKKTSEVENLLNLERSSDKFG
jgi:hypothetical protein